MKELTIYIQQILFSLHAIPLHVNVDPLENGYMVECSFVKKNPNLCSSFQLAVEKDYLKALNKVSKKDKKTIYG